MITIDGSQGEGGGQILRTALSLSLVTRQPFRIQQIRAGRAKPGLLRQHLAAVQAAAEIGQGNVEGATLGSMELLFQPGNVTPGEFHFDVGSAGSATLVLQTVLPPLIIGTQPSRLTLEGGTHNPHAPPFPFLKSAFLPLLNTMGPRVSAHLETAGFYPAGGGRFTVEIHPAAKLIPLHILQRTGNPRCSARSLISRLPAAVAQRELKVVSDKLHWPPESLHIDHVRSLGPGNVLLLELAFDNITELFTGFGERGLPAETVAENVTREAQEYLASGLPVGEHLADQLLLPIALAGAGSFLTSKLSLHTRTNIDIISLFLPGRFSVDPAQGGFCISLHSP